MGVMKEIAIELQGREIPYIPETITLESGVKVSKCPKCKQVILSKEHIDKCHLCGEKQMTLFGESA